MVLPRNEWFHDDGTLTSDFMNRALVYIYNQYPPEEFIEDMSLTDPGEQRQVRKFWSETLQWMKDNPLKPGQTWDTAPD